MKLRVIFHPWMLLVVAALALAYAHYVQRADLRERQAVLDEVIEEVRLAQPKPGQEREFRLDDLANAKSLRPVGAGEIFGAGQLKGRVWATITPGGSLKVMIVTYDGGHSGSDGFVYSDTRQSPDTESTDWDWDVRSPPIDSASAIDGHWWQMHWSD